MTAAGLGTLGSVTELRFAIDIAPLGDLSDPRTIVRLARAAEESGWDGVSIWDSLGLSMSSSAADLFVALAGIAAQTTRLKLITSIVALARRRPQLVVQAAATLDQLSNGRLVLGLGAGEDRPDFEAFGESHDRTDRIALMDESLAIVDAGLRGAELHHEGPRLRASSVVLGPRPAQQPRPPIWLGAFKPGGIRRAARWDGWIAVAMSEDGSGMAMSADGFAGLTGIALMERLALGRAGEPFDVAVLGISSADDHPSARFGDAGATWWLESLSPMRGPVEALEAIVRHGPPR
jgi:alkanesulfonate monooxygenase SsuD/methylene tetrahydromethanopterin reductase-like flavin-dependent oxidoreductase (luciferase family)